MISDQEMEHLKTLARLELGAEETQSLKADLNAILEYFEQLRDLATEGVAPLVRPIDAVNVWRDDVVQDGLPQESVLGLAIEAQDGFFKVPRTVE
ncbi:MAG: Asp-tRNA(Asn)/Glu-tRNA(Gln) amidotransferase subunit GatC [Truepera sp.]|nr:Asp-tRNA(Asn)/Glu-tRNA(Gln) amidotransferase subunit GatC [Truepera sp.]